MSEPTTAPTTPPSAAGDLPVKRSAPGAGRWVAGLVLIMVGVLILVGQYGRGSWIELLVLPGLALVFLAWGISARNAGPIIPGCILAGIGLGIILEKTVVTAGADDSGAIFLLTMALGFAAITPMTALFAGGRQIWGVIVGVILAVIGGALLIGGQAMRALELVGQASPVLLIVLGIWLMVQQSRSNRSR